MRATTVQIHRSTPLTPACGRICGKHHSSCVTAARAAFFLLSVGLLFAQLHGLSVRWLPSCRQCHVATELTCCRSTFRVVMEGKFTLPDTMSPNAADLITQLLQVALQSAGSRA